MPMMPPIALSVTASMRNCVRMSRPCAPTARRTPISRVRSVTLTSMIFMIPMPPTMSETLAIAPSSNVMTLEVAVAVSAISCWLRTVKSSSRPVADVVPLAEEGGDLLLRRLEVVWRC